MMRLLVAAALGGLLIGCQAPGPRDESSFAQTIQAGSTFTVTRDLPVAVGSARVTIQRGEVVDSADRTSPSCQFRTGQTATEDMPVVIKADTFTIGKPSRFYAAATLLVAQGGEGGSRRSRGVPRTKFPLSSPRQPTIRQLLCDSTGSGGRHLSIADLRGALGAIVELELVTH